MKLFHQLDDQDQHNAIHYCMHLTIDDFFDDGIDIEINSEEDQKVYDLVEKVFKDAEKIQDKSDQFDFIMKSEVADIIYEVSLDMAKSAYYHSNDEIAIHYEDLRSDHGDENDEIEKELIEKTKKNNKHNLN